MITICTTQAQVDAIPEPKHVWRDGEVWRVFTGADIPVPEVTHEADELQAVQAALDAALAELAALRAA